MDKRTWYQCIGIAHVYRDGDRAAWRRIAGMIRQDICAPYIRDNDSAMQCYGMACFIETLPSSAAGEERGR